MATVPLLIEKLGTRRVDLDVGSTALAQIQTKIENRNSAICSFCALVLDEMNCYFVTNMGVNCK